MAKRRIARSRREAGEGNEVMTLNEHRQAFTAQLEELLAELVTTQTATLTTLNNLRESMSCIGVILDERPSQSRPLKDYLEPELPS